MANDEREQEMAEWDAYWSALTPEQRAEELASMDRHVAEAEERARREGRR